MSQEEEEFLRISGVRPTDLQGTITLPSSKSYFHRALFVSSLCNSQSRIEVADYALSDDMKATVEALEAFGVRIQKLKNKRSHVNLVINPGEKKDSNKKENTIYCGGSGTTARFAIAFAAIASDGTRSLITGDASLSKRPMRPLIDALTELGVGCHSENAKGTLPVVVEAHKGIRGGSCEVDGSISSQFISALLISCTQAQSDTVIKIKHPAKMVSVPYISATECVLKHFRFKIQSTKSRDLVSFRVKGNQTKVKGRHFAVPGDLSSGAALIGATIGAQGRIQLQGANLKMPQADAAFLDLAKDFGAVLSRKGKDSLLVSAVRATLAGNPRKQLVLDLKDSPDTVPIASGVAAALGRKVKIRNVGHLRFKESDRLYALAKALRQLGIRIIEGKDSLFIDPAPEKKEGKRREGRSHAIFLSSQNDHRILMALTIAGISGKFGEFYISNPSCVRKSYPEFIEHVKNLAGPGILTIVRRSRRN